MVLCGDETPYCPVMNYGVQNQKHQEKLFQRFLMFVSYTRKYCTPKSLYLALNFELRE